MKLKERRDGSFTMWTAIAVIVVVAIICATAFLAMGVNSYQSDKGSDSGVTPENVIGTFYLSATIEYSHPLTGVVDSYLQTPTVQFQRTSSMQVTTIYSLKPDLMGWLDDDVYQYLQFHVYSFELEYDEYSDQEATTFSAKCGLGQTVTKTIDCPQGFKVKDPGMYSIEAKLYQRHEGTQAWELVDTKVASYEVTL